MPTQEQKNGRDGLRHRALEAAARRQQKDRGAIEASVAQMEADLRQSLRDRMHICFESLVTCTKFVYDDLGRPVWVEGEADGETFRYHHQQGLQVWGVNGWRSCQTWESLGAAFSEEIR